MVIELTGLINPYEKIVNNPSHLQFFFHNRQLGTSQHLSSVSDWLLLACQNSTTNQRTLVLTSSKYLSSHYLTSSHISHHNTSHTITHHTSHTPHLKQVSVITQIFWVIILMIFSVNQLLTQNTKQLRKEHSLWIKEQFLDKKK